MRVNWDQHLLEPLHNEFGDRVEYRPKNGKPYPITGIFDRAYTQNVEPLEDGSTINTTSPVLGIRDAEMLTKPNQGDRVLIDGTLFAVSDVQPDSHGGTKLILNRVKS